MANSLVVNKRMSADLCNVFRTMVDLRMSVDPLDVFRTRAGLRTSMESGRRLWGQLAWQI